MSQQAIYGPGDKETDVLDMSKVEKWHYTQATGRMEIVCFWVRRDSNAFTNNYLIVNA